MIRITAPYFVAGVVLDVDNLRVVGAAPILKYMIGWTRQHVLDHCRHKRWQALVC